MKTEILPKVNVLDSRAVAIKNVLYEVSFLFFVFFFRSYTHGVTANIRKVKIKIPRGIFSIFFPPPLCWRAHRGARGACISSDFYSPSVYCRKTLNKIGIKTTSSVTYLLRCNAFNVRAQILCKLPHVLRTVCI